VKKVKTIFFAASAALLLGGCVISPDYYPHHNGSGMQVGDPCNPPNSKAIQAGFAWSQSTHVPGVVGEDRDFWVWQNSHGVWYCEYAGHGYSRGKINTKRHYRSVQ